MKITKELIGAIIFTSLINILIFLIISIFTRQEEPEYIIKNEQWYMMKLKQFARECFNKESINYDCLHKKIRKNIPPNYYVHVRPLKNEKGQSMWGFVCIDTTKPGREAELREALEAR